MAYLATAVAALSAAAMFFILCERDHSFLIQASQPEHQSYVIPDTASSPAAIPAHTAAAPSSPARDVQQPKVQTAAEYIPFVITRSKRFQRVGPIAVGLWRTDPKHDTYDASVVIDGHRFDKKHISVDEALAIRIGSAPAMELIVNRVGKNDITGYLSKPRQLAAR